MMTRFFILIGLILSIFFTAIYNAWSWVGKEDGSKAMIAVKITNLPQIDGDLADEVWKDAPVCTHFLTFEPTVGKVASQRSEVRVLYSDEAIYIGAYLYDTAPDSILHELGNRDAFGSINSDAFMVGIDTYNDDQNAFMFSVTPANVQGDLRHSNGSEDIAWNAVWYSKARIVDDGWTVEMRIPYTALRFGNNDHQNWGILFIRNLRRLRERSAWGGFDPSQNGFVQQFGTLQNLENLRPPLRLSITPYFSVYGQWYTDPHQRENNSFSRQLKGGCDVKYGINQSYTLDMMLVPDFGQVVSDDRVLNISPFEVRYQENRPFFTEGTELFNRGGVFYSRRIGGMPSRFFEPYDALSEGERVAKNPAEVQLYNATKISGRNSNNLGIGVLNALAGNVYATIEHENGDTRKYKTEPLTNYNVSVIDQLFKNQSYVSLVNTNVWRSGDAPDANVTATEFRFSGDKRRYALTGVAAVSQIFEHNKADLGYMYYWDVSKVSGNWQYGLLQNTESHTYNPNDLGYLGSNNEFTNRGFVSYQTFERTKNIQGVFARLDIIHSMLYKPLQFTDFKATFNGNITFPNFLTVGINSEARPIRGRDYFEPRLEGYYNITSDDYWANFWLSSDYRKAFALDAWAGVGRSPFYDIDAYWFGFAPRLRINDRLSFKCDFDYTQKPTDLGFATITSEPSGDEVAIYGYRKYTTAVSSFTGRYTFTSRMSLNLRARHYWSTVLYDSYLRLQPNGSFMPDSNDFLQDTQFSAFNVDLQYNWEFSPGSMLSLVWKSNIFKHDNYDSSPDEYAALKNTSYFNGFSKTFTSPQLNTVSFRFLYLIDYQMFEQFRRKKAR